MRCPRSSWFVMLSWLAVLAACGDEAFGDRKKPDGPPTTTGGASTSSGSQTVGTGPGSSTSTGSGGASGGVREDAGTGWTSDAPLISVSDAARGDAPQASDCTDAARNFVYVMGPSLSTFATALYKFAPDKKTFTLVGNLDCPGNGGVNSMAVDRKGIAWVNWGSQVFRVNTADAKCTSAPAIDLPMAWARIGMGFSIDAVGTEAETLFVSNHGAVSGGTAPSALAKLDASGMLNMVAPFSGGNFSGMSAELTGTGDARLYGFFINPNNMNPNVDPVFGLADKTSAAVSKIITLTGLSTATGGANNCTNGGGCITSWAFSFWGGRFYFYTGHGQASVVTEYDPFAETGNGITLQYTSAPLTIVGAGVSTCAPTVPPIVR